MTTDTPRTDTCPYCGHAWSKSWEMWDCGTFEQTKGLFRTELCYEREARQKAEAEVERLKKMVMEAARKGDELLAPYRLRAEKAETLINQIYAFAEALNPTNK